ncbi:hypothetical protein OVY48_09945 [Sphingobium sp. SA2]|uniref:hypothetical protein n=1 Tax=Sphingobium sp. SA2 TaxID=1524832 RepID=UPI0028C2886F|nr:hypothetical protein [Sphingobium sp. SA2]MDT7533745.1 hypothetical protein [Sphingobium sp. SA2]
MRSRAGRGKLRKVQLIPANAMALLSQAGVRASAGEPHSVVGYYDPAGEPRRVVARYADGWRADLRFHVDGTYSLTQSLRMRAVAVTPVIAEGTAGV